MKTLNQLKNLALKSIDFTEVYNEVMRYGTITEDLRNDYARQLTLLYNKTIEVYFLIIKGEVQEVGIKNLAD